MIRYAYLRLGEPEGGCERGSFRQREVLRSLEAPVELLQLQARVDGARLARLLAFLAGAPGRVERRGRGRRRQRRRGAE